MSIPNPIILFLCNYLDPSLGLLEMIVVTSLSGAYFPEKEFHHNVPLKLRFVTNMVFRPLEYSICFLQLIFAYKWIHL